MNPAKRWRLLGIVMAALVSLSALGDRGRTALRYDRAAIAAGEWWRIVTGHIVHLGWGHLAMNCAALVMLWILFPAEYSTVAWCVLAVASAATIGLGLWFFDPQLQWYVGLSGVLHAIVCAGCIAMLRKRRWEAAVLLALVIVKIGYEQLVGPLPMHGPDMRAMVVVDAHLYGVVAGLVFGLLFAARKTRPLGASSL